MRFLKLEHPLFFPYSGNLRDTAILVGFKNVRAPLGMIVYCGDSSFQARRYVVILNEWLLRAGMPVVEMPAQGQQIQARFLARSPLEEWGWGEEECAAAIRLAGLPLPPSPANTNAQ